MFHLMWIFNGTDPPGRTFSAFIYDTDMHGYVNHISMKIWHFHQKFLQNTNQPLLSIDIYQYLTVAEICVPQEFAHIIWFFTLGGKSPVIVGVPKTWVSYDLMKRPGSSGSNGEPWCPGQREHMARVWVLAPTSTCSMVLNLISSTRKWRLSYLLCGANASPVGGICD